jgi:hypothetical protein
MAAPRPVATSVAAWSGLTAYLIDLITGRAPVTPGAPYWPARPSCKQPHGPRMACTKCDLVDLFRNGRHYEVYAWYSGLYT